MNGNPETNYLKTHVKSQLNITPKYLDTSTRTTRQEKLALQNIKIDFVYRNPPRYLNTDYREGHTINRDKTRKYSLKNFLFKFLRKEGKPCENVCKPKGNDRPPADVLPPPKKGKNF